MPEAKLEVVILDTQTGTRTMVVCEMPAEIGRRSPGLSRCIEFDSQYDMISRRHATIEMSKDGLQFRDHSTNGSIISGQSVHNTTVSLTLDSVIRIAHFELTACDIVPFVIKQTTVAMNDLVEIPLPTAGRLEIVADNNKIARLHVPKDSTNTSSAELLLSMAQNGGHISCSRGPRIPEKQIKINKLAIHDSTFSIHAFDVLELSGMRFEVVRPDTAMIACGNPKCHLLNPAVFEQNCKWCGFHLAASGGLSRPVTKNRSTSIKK